MPKNCPEYRYDGGCSAVVQFTGENQMTLEQRAFDVLKEAHDLIKSESSFKTAQRVTLCSKGEFAETLDVPEEKIQDSEEARRYVEITFEKPKMMDRQDICDLNDIPALKNRDKIWFEGSEITFQLIEGEKL